MPREVAEGFAWDLEEAVSPVRLAAQAKAPTSMRNMVRTREWAAMRSGITRRKPASVYVVPQLRGDRKRKRSQKQKEVFAERMQTRALDPALRENEQNIKRKVEDFLDHLANVNGF